MFKSQPSKVHNQQTTHGIAFVLVFSVFPYIYNLIICTITMGSIRKSLIGTTIKKDLRINAERDLQNYKVFRMTSIMVAGFSFTMLPYGIICSMFYTASINCQGHTPAYTIITFLRYFSKISIESNKINSLTSCVINSSIYNFLSKNFRTQVVSMIGIKRVPVTVSNGISHNK